MATKTKLEILINKFNKPIKIREKYDFLSLYLGIKTTEIEDEYEIYYIEKNIPKFIKTGLIGHLFTIFNEIELMTKGIMYLVPDNKCVPTYIMELPVHFENSNFIRTNNENDSILINMTIEQYYDFYQKRYHKIPLISIDNSYCSVELNHYWISKILI